MSMKSRIEAKLTQALQPERLEIVNESHLHAGHHHTDRGHDDVFDGTGETHFRIRVVSPRFTGLNRIARHRAVNDLLVDEMRRGLHALAIEPAAPGEPTRW